MTLTAGSRLGPYEIVAPLGAGGMGEVYRARDTRLDRTVAVKVLPTHLSSSPESRQRFEREAKTISQLSHPHICALHDVGREGDIEYLVMEYLEGETLADRLLMGPLPLEQTLRYGIEIADALDKAHRQGIVHRDLKPGNVMITKSGVKLLDFGLAKAIAPAVLQSSLTALPTQAGLTQEGTILGTFQYMAPEQLEGKEADARTDIFTLGSVLHEMATGQKSFSGATQASLISSILRDEPRPISSVHPMSPAAFDHVVKKCLAKDPEDRWQSAHDVASELTWIREGGSAVGIAAPVGARRRSRSRLARVAAVVVLLTLGAAAGSLFRPRPAPGRAVRMSIVAPPELTVSAEPSEIAVSPDGSTIAFVATDSNGLRRIWLRSLDSLSPQSLAGTEGARTPFWSPDGRFIAFFADSKLKKTSRDGGVPVTLADAPSARGGSWGSAKEIVFAASSGGPLLRVDENGGATSAASELGKGEASHRFPSFLPDGRRFLYVSLPQLRPGELPIRLGSLDGVPRPGPEVAAGSGAAVFAAPGYILYGRRDAVVAQPFDPKRWRVTGSPVTLREVLNVVGSAGGVPAVSVSANGVLVQTPSGLADSRLVWLNRKGEIIGSVSAPPAAWGSPAVSPDGTRVLLVRPSSERWDIWQVDLARGGATPMTFENNLNFAPTWSPDGRRFAFASGGGNRSIYLRDASGAGSAELLAQLTGLFNNTTDWSRDGTTLILRRLDPATGEDIWILPASGDRKPIPFLKTKFNEQDGRLSPDGRWIAYRSDESGRMELYVQPFPAGGARVRVSTEGAGELEGFQQNLVWTTDGRELIFLGGDGVTVMVAPIPAGVTVKVGTPRALFKLPPGTTGWIPTPDGSRFFTCLTVPGTVASTARVVIGWTAELEKK